MKIIFLSFMLLTFSICFGSIIEKKEVEPASEWLNLPDYLLENTNDFSGYIEDFGVKNAYLLGSRGNTTLVHEAYHGFGLRHTFKDGNEPIAITQKFTYPKEETFNIMSYSPERLITWRWQWKIANSKIK